MKPWNIPYALQIMLQALCLVAASALVAPAALAETCTTQSAMPAADRAAIATAAQALAALVKAGDTAALKAAADADLAKDSNGLQYLIGTTAPRLTAAALTLDSIYLLDATTTKPAIDGATTSAQFFCSLNNSTMEVEFTIPNLPPGRYAFAIVIAAGAAPWRLSMLLRQDSSNHWLLAGLYPSAMTAAGHDGLWYWQQARTMTTAKQPWNAWLYYRQAEKLLQPAAFVDSTHLEKLRTEAASAAPPALSQGIGAEAPLVIKSAAGVEYRFTALGVDDSLGQVDVAVHLPAEVTADATAARKRNNDAASALLAACPELRTAFHGVWVFAESPGKPAFATEAPMADLH
jgi:hypothetical protein